MSAAFDELRKLDEGAEWGDTRFANSADTLGHVLELVRQYHVSLPGHICAVVVTTLVLEGWSNKLDPDHSVLTQVSRGSVFCVC
jgi:aarF domain-containing kinase